MEGERVKVVFDAFNLGSQNGFSVREVIEVCRKVTSLPIEVEEAPRRPGDPPFLVADSSRAARTLGFKSRSNPLEWIVSSAWEWEKVLNEKIKSGLFRS